MDTKPDPRANAAHLLRSGHSRAIVARLVPQLPLAELIDLERAAAQVRASLRPPVPERELHVRQFLAALGTLQREAARLEDSVPAKLVRAALDTAKRWTIEL